ncbi:MAG: hypothetical protein ACQGVC_02370 [Myxococcota bacterium]
MRRGLLAALAACLLASGALAAADAHVAVPGTGVQLVVPEGFRLSDAFPGIGRDTDLTSVLVTELAVPVVISRADFDATGLAQQGLRVQRIVRVEVDGREGWLAHASQHSGGVPFRKWLLLLGDERRSVLLTATTPLDLEAQHQRALVETLSTARWRPQEPDTAGARDSLPFRVAEIPPLRILRSAANAVVLADDATAPGRVEPLVSVGASQALVQIRDLPAFARRRLDESVLVQEIEVEDERPRPLDGMPGYWIAARARDVRSDREVAVTQLLATDGTRYYLLQSIVDADDRAAFAPVFERVVESFRLAR